MGLSTLGKSQMCLDQPKKHGDKTEEFNIITSVLVE